MKFLKALIWFLVIIWCLPMIGLGMLGGAAIDWIQAQWDWLMKPIEGKRGPTP